MDCGFDASVLPGLVDVLGAGTCGAETMVAARVCEGAWCLSAPCRFVQLQPGRTSSLCGIAFTCLGGEMLGTGTRDATSLVQQQSGKSRQRLLRLSCFLLPPEVGL